MAKPGNTPYPSKIWGTPAPPLAAPGALPAGPVNPANLTDSSRTGVNRTANVAEETAAYWGAYAEAARIKAKLEAMKNRATMKVATTTKPPPEAKPTTVPLTTLPPTTTTTVPPTPKPWNWWSTIHEDPHKLTIEERREELRDIAEIFGEASKLINVSAHDLANATKELALNVTIEMSELHGLDLMGVQAAKTARMMKKLSKVCHAEWVACAEEGQPICPSAIQDVFKCMEEEDEAKHDPCIEAIVPGGGPTFLPLLECGSEHGEEILQAGAPPPPPK